MMTMLGTVTADDLSVRGAAEIGDGDPATDPAVVEAAAAAALEASRALLGIVARSLVPALDRVTPPQFRALVLLVALGPTRIGELADRLGVHQSTLTRTAGRLYDGGFLQRTSNPGNHREVILEATEDGEELIRAVDRSRHREVVEVLGRLTAVQRASVLTGLQVLSSAVAEPPPELLASLGG